MSDTDLELLARYTRHLAEDAFAELVRRHLDLVHSAALRQVRSPHLAEEVAQSTFLKLAQNAPQLAPDTVLSAWLYQVTRREAIDVVRREARRQLREQIATEMNALNATAADWTNIEPLLDEAMHALDETDRAAVLLRYFENKSLREVGQALGASENAAQKRLTRAVEQLREFFTQRGVTVGGGGLGVIISANAVQAAPVGLAITILSTVAISGTAFLTTATATTTKAIAMTTLQKTLFATVLAVAIGTVFNEVHKSSGLKAKLLARQEQNALLTDQLAKSNRDREEALRQAGALQSRDQSAAAELLRLRGEVARLRRQLAEIAGVQPTPAAPKPAADAPEPVQTFVANADARIPVGQTLAIGGWATAAGKRTIMLVTPTVVDEAGRATTVAALAGRPGQIVLEGQIFEMPDEVLDKTIANLNLPGVGKLKTDEKATSSHSLLTSDEANLLFKTLKETAEVELLSAPHVLTLDGRQAVLSVTENKMVAGREHALGPSLDVEPRIAADGSSVNLTVSARLCRASSP
jgi:RNA polymerase sigma factor (sigma-70 family)